MGSPFGYPAFSIDSIHNTKGVDELKLKPLREINMEVSSFLSKRKGVMKLKEYELNFENMDSSSGKLIKCLCVPKICPNIKGESVKQELKKRDFIKKLKLADSSISPVWILAFNAVLYRDRLKNVSYVMI